MLYSSIEGAAMNVIINLSGLDDDILKKNYQDIVEEILFETEKLKDKLLEEVKYLMN